MNNIYLTISIIVFVLFSRWYFKGIYDKPKKHVMKANTGRFGYRGILSLFTKDKK